MNKIDKSGEPLPAVVRICPNGTEGVTVLEKDIEATIALIELQGGATYTKPLDVGNGWFFMWGVKILVGE